jgi:hypothetical protein
MIDSRITFDEMPAMLATIAERLKSIEDKVNHLTLPQQEEKDEWFNIKGLCEYLPSHPAEQTVYGWTSTHFIPFHKRGKNIAFRKSEIDQWLGQGMKKSLQDIQRDAQEFVNHKRMKGGRHD